MESDPLDFSRRASPNQEDFAQVPQLNFAQFSQTAQVSPTRTSQESFGDFIRFKKQQVKTPRNNKSAKYKASEHRPQSKHNSQSILSGVNYKTVDINSQVAGLLQSQHIDPEHLSTL